MGRGKAWAVGVVLACALSACSFGDDDVDPTLAASDYVAPAPDSRVLPYLLTASDLGSLDAAIQTSAPLPDCGVEAVASGTSGAMVGGNVGLERAYLFASKADARRFYERITQGTCPDRPKLPRLKVAAVGDASFAYRYDQEGGGTFAAYILNGRVVLHVVTVQDKQTLRTLMDAAAAKASKAG